MINFFEDILNQRLIKVTPPIKWGHSDCTWGNFDQPIKVTLSVNKGIDDWSLV